MALTRNLKTPKTRILPAAYPNGRGQNQPSGNIRVRNAHPLKRRPAAPRSVANRGY